MKTLTIFGLAALTAGLLIAGPYNVGSKVENFTIKDLNGQSVNFSDLKGDVTVVMFIATQCPISNDYNQRMNELYNEFAGKGVKFVFVNSNVSEPAAEVGEHAKANSFPFKVYKDPGNQAADRFGAQVTPEAFVIDKEGTVRYHGYIDDSRNAANIKVRGLKNALDLVLSGQSVANAQTKAFGCTIKREKKAS